MPQICDPKSVKVRDHKGEGGVCGEDNLADNALGPSRPLGGLARDQFLDVAPVLDLLLEARVRRDLLAEVASGDAGGALKPSPRSISSSTHLKLFGGKHVQAILVMRPKDHENCINVFCGLAPQFDGSAPDQLNAVGMSLVAQ